MSGAPLPIHRPMGRALLVGNPTGRARSLHWAQRLGLPCAERDDPYAAMAELCRRPLVYRTLILSLAGVYREELQMLAAIKQRFPHVEVWLSDTDGRAGALAEACRLGADALVSEEGVHRFNGLSQPMEEPVAADSAEQDPVGPAAPPISESRTAHEASSTSLEAEGDSTESPETEAALAASMGEPILTADELRALLQDPPRQD